jgi:hypothetical protein
MEGMVEVDVVETMVEVEKAIVAEVREAVVMVMN